MASKYGNVKTEVDGYLFASKLEARRYRELKLMEKAKQIEDLTVHPEFAIRVLDKPICTYIGDFAYWVGRASATCRIVEDCKCKATKTPVYQLKKKLMRAIYNIEIKEITKEEVRT